MAQSAQPITVTCPQCGATFTVQPTQQQPAPSPNRPAREPTGGTMTEVDQARLLDELLRAAAAPTS